MLFCHELCPLIAGQPSFSEFVFPTFLDVIRNDCPATHRRGTTNALRERKDEFSGGAEMIKEG